MSPSKKPIWSSLLVLVFLLFFATPRASAAVIGTLATTACSGTGVTVSFTLIDWLPAGGGSGCIDTVAPTNVSYTGGGPLLPAATGTILDLVLGAPLPDDFMTFAGHPNLHFDLTAIGPGVASTACPDTFNPVDPVCSAVAGSPFVLRPGGGGTTVSLAVFGEARDLSGIISTWVGTFSVDFAGETPFDLQQRFLSTGSVTSGHSGSFVVTPIPEPASLLLFGTGLVGAALRARKGQRNRKQSA